MIERWYRAGELAERARVLAMHVRSHVAREDLLRAARALERAGESGDAAELDIAMSHARAILAEGER